MGRAAELTVGLVAKAHKRSLQLMLNLLEHLDGLLLGLMGLPELYGVHSRLVAEWRVN
jgi:hypothetical protein